MEQMFLFFFLLRNACNGAKGLMGTMARGCGLALSMAASLGPLLSSDSRIIRTFANRKCPPSAAASSATNSVRETLTTTTNH